MKKNCGIKFKNDLYTLTSDITRPNPPFVLEKFLLKGPRY